MKYRCNGLVFESLVDLKKQKRKVADAVAEATSNAIQGFDPGEPIAAAHRKAKNAAISSVRNEMKGNNKLKKDEEPNNITVSTNFMKEGRYVEPKDGNLVVGVHIYMPEKKGFFKRFLSGSIGNWFQDVGVVALKNYVSAFAGKTYASEVTKDTVSNAIGEDENSGKTSYYVVLKIPRAAK